MLASVVLGEGVNSRAVAIIVGKTTTIAQMLLVQKVFSHQSLFSIEIKLKIHIFRKFLIFIFVKIHFSSLISCIQIDPWISQMQRFTAET